ncbi:MAG TPA: hypothetical protein VG797_09090 [Phycisphaerales bacterium]|nr:hypothetical protein [Phycisphaerales bacterium]
MAAVAMCAADGAITGDTSPHRLVVAERAEQNEATRYFVCGVTFSAACETERMGRVSKCVGTESVSEIVGPAGNVHASSDPRALLLTSGEGATFVSLVIPAE